MKSHKEHLNKHKVEILKRMADHVHDTGKNEVPLKVLSDNINDYNNAQKLRYHALIFKIKRGVWGITSHGWDFLRGNKDLSKWVIISENRIEHKSTRLINIRNAYQGSTVVDVTFEYYDNGVPMGIRPMDSIVNQLELI
jgi:hypothetical protein